MAAHMTSRFTQATTSPFPTLLSRCNRVPLRNRSFMGFNAKLTPGVEQPHPRAPKNEANVERDAKTNAVGVMEDYKPQRRPGSDQSTSSSSTSNASNANQDPDSQERLDAGLTPPKKRAKMRQSLRRSKHSVEEDPPTVGVHHVATALPVARGGGQPWQHSQDQAREGWGAVRIGTSGYVYKHWKNVVYPEGVAQRHWFELYTRLFDTVEINNTFYKLPAPEAFKSWRVQAPSGFCYALKFSRWIGQGGNQLGFDVDERIVLTGLEHKGGDRYLTHMKRLTDPEGAISLFLERANRLGTPLLGPILVQLPPRFDLSLERLECFLKHAPREYRWAIEFRDSRWLVDDVYALLRAYNASLVIHDHEDLLSLHPQVVTADWIYLRFHGRNYTERYSLDALQKHAMWIRAQMEAGRDVFVYFNNDMGGHAVFNALELREFVRIIFCPSSFPFPESRC